MSPISAAFIPLYESAKAFRRRDMRRDDAFMPRQLPPARRPVIISRIRYDFAAGRHRATAAAFSPPHASIFFDGFDYADGRLSTLRRKVIGRPSGSVTLRHTLAREAAARNMQFRHSHMSL